jgi:hypothetical protein
MTDYKNVREMLFAIIHFFEDENGNPVSDGYFAIRGAIKAVEKQIPVDPQRGCGHTVERKYNYCPYCGQKIDWSERGDAE